MARKECGWSLALMAQADSRTFSWHVAGTLAARVLMAANSVVAGIIVARWLGAEGLGALAALSVAVNTTMQISSLGVPTANTYFIAPEKRLAAPAAVNSTLFALLSGSGFALTVFACVLWQPSLLGNLPASLVGLAFVAVPFQLATLLGTNLFLVAGQVRRFNGLDILNQSFVLINAVVALIILGGGLWLLVSLNVVTAAAASILTGAMLYRYVAKLQLVRWRPDLALLKRMLRYALKGHILWAAMVVILRVDLLIVNSLRGAAEAGVYSVATQYTLFLMLLPNVVALLMLPRVAATPGAASAFTCAVARHTSLALFVACLASFWLALALPLIYGPAFAGAPSLVWVLLPGVFFWGVQMALVQFFVGTGLPKLIPAMWVATLALNVVLNLLLVPKFGARGAALVSTISYALIFGAVFIRFRQQTGHQLGDVLICTRDELRRVLALRSFHK